MNRRGFLKLSLALGAAAAVSLPVLARAPVRAVARGGASTRPADGGYVRVSGTTWDGQRREPFEQFFGIPDMFCDAVLTMEALAAITVNGFDVFDPEGRTIVTDWDRAPFYLLAADTLQMTYRPALRLA